MKTEHIKQKWEYSSFRALLRKNGKPFAVVSPDGRDALNATDETELMTALNGNAELLDAAQKALIWFEAFQPSFPPSTAIGSTVEGTIEILRAAIAKVTQP